MTTVRSFRLQAADFSALRAHAFARGRVLERDGLSVLGLGRVAELPLPLGLSDPAPIEEATLFLRSLGPPGTPASELPLALGALAFRPDGPSELLVPAVTVTKDASGPRAVVVSDDGAHEELLASLLTTAFPDADALAAPDRFELYSARPHEHYLDLVAQAVSEIRTGRLDKIVLAREVVIEANRPFSQADLLERLRSLHPSCLTFAVDGFLGATPELLMRRSGDELRSDPLAGTCPRSGDAEADRIAQFSLLSSEKERAEHAAVVESIAGSLAPVLARLEVPPVPEVVELRNVAHLRTRIRGVLPSVESGPSVLQALALVHPTPAVAGSPVPEAVEYLAKCEGLERGRYAGPVGFLRADGDGEFHLAIRCAVVEGDRARLFAGAGIVADSDPTAELRETQLKLQAVLAAAVRP